jgi:diguanylate cyclase (GGDEF)-like protein/PAS domain S-box-containing protein
MLNLATTAPAAGFDARRDSTGPTLAQRTGALGRQLFFAQRIMESSACPILLIDMSPDPLINYVSPALESLTGYAAHELLGRPWTLFFAPSVLGSELNASRYRLNSVSPFRTALDARHKKGAALHLDATVTPLLNDAGRVTHRILVLRDVTADRLERSKLEYRAHHDPLTGLANRHLLHDRFELAAAHSRRHDEPFAVVIVDLNGFKLINDRLGHEAGDILLKRVGERLKEVVRAEDTVARLGGDEFALLIAEAKAESIPRIMDRLRDSLSRPAVIASDEIAVGYCAGCARFPDDGTDLAALLREADSRLYSEKARLSVPTAMD